MHFLRRVKHTLTALDLQRAGLCVQRKAAQVHVAHGGDSHSAVEGGGVWKKKKTQTSEKSQGTQSNESRL